jgi:hypothetical protein
MSNRGIIYRASLILYNCAMTAPFLRALSLTPAALDYMKAVKKECVPPPPPRAREQAKRVKEEVGGGGSHASSLRTLFLFGGLRVAEVADPATRIIV